MTVTSKEIIESKYAGTADTPQYIAEAVTIVDKMTVTNNSGSTALFTVNLVPSGGSVGNSNMVISEQPIRPNESYICPEVSGHVLDVSATIYTKSSADSALVIRASGRVLT
jgi:hypothetical protein